ncbi:MAG: hypothetical protein AAGA57_04230 [Planctomycetota bacterium]
MLYLVSGASRTGKSILAKRVLDERHIPFVSLDWLVIGFTGGLPGQGIHDKLMPDEIATKMWGFVEAMLTSMLWVGGDYVIEGEALLPGDVRGLMDRYPDEVRACFLGYADVDAEAKLAEIRAYRSDERDWLVKESDETIRGHIANMVSHSRKMQAGCAKHGVRYFDTAVDFLQTLDDAMAYLMGSA